MNSVTIYDNELNDTFRLEKTSQLFQHIDKSREEDVCE